ncbi:MAG TPA: amidase [Tepidisphaeraceae bacterium]|jgi:Asp-tRNA(Asn)/Glu-tRNA(Gln) amidotransferase A subunit family amidase|nr:amidase [Tepidisphaeraceae bacterium]
MKKREMRAGVSRRRVIQSIAAIGATSIAGGGLAATTEPTGIVPGDVEALNKVFDHPYSASESELMVEGLTTKREVISRNRQKGLAYTTPLAVSFRVEGEATPFLAEAIDGPPMAYNGDPASLAFASVADLSRLIQARKVSSVELTKMYLKRLKEIGPRLNCVINLTEDLAMGQAKRADEELAAGKSRGPLHGVPWGAKDLLAVRNYPTTWGVEIYQSRVFDHDAAVVQKLEAAGAVLCAKLSLGELCMGDTWYGGMTRCPWNPKEGSSGSSAGPCAGVAAGLVGFAIGSETLGSIVSPCMVNGTMGLRPTFGRVPGFGAMVLSNTMDKLGPIARSVEDLGVILAAIVGGEMGDVRAEVKPLRVGYDVEAFNFDTATYKKNPALKEMYQKAFDQMRAVAGREMVPVHLPAAKDYVGLASLVIACESANNFMGLLTSGDIRKLKQQGDGTWPNTFRVGSCVPAADYLRGMQLRTQLMGAMKEAMKEVDCYLTLPYVGPTISYTNLTGHPSVVFRGGFFKDRPKMIELIGQPFREDQILKLALMFEKGTGHHTRWPDTSAIP